MKNDVLNTNLVLLLCSHQNGYTICVRHEYKTTKAIDVFMTENFSAIYDSRCCNTVADPAVPNGGGAKFPSPPLPSLPLPSLPLAAKRRP
jgi:hypothetical protein